MTPFSAEWFFSLILLILPAYFANSAPLYVNPHKGKSSATPVDFGRNFVDGHRIFGDGKTWEGLVGGIAAGWLAGSLMGMLGFIPLGFSFDQWFWISLFLGMGAMAGDLVGSFVKRRLDVGRGGRFPYFDQLGFVILSLAFATAAAPEIGYSIGFWGYAVLLLLSYCTHIFFNWFAFKIGLKSVPW